MLSFQHLLESFEKEFQIEIQNIQTTAPVNLYEPIAYSLELRGKRIRPVLLLHAASLLPNIPKLSSLLLLPLSCFTILPCCTTISWIMQISAEEFLQYMSNTAITVPVS